MFHRTQERFRLYRARFSALVLLPAIFFGTLPQTACICADGHREANCPKLACSLKKFRVADQRPGCCHGGRKAAATTNNSAETSNSAETRIVFEGRCCRPVIEAPAPVLVGMKTTIDCTATHATTTDSIAFDLAVVSRPILDFSSPPPPLDTVIVFQHLTI